MTTTPARRGARVATLVAGGLVAGLALAATTTGALVALGAADTSQHRLVLPDRITPLEVQTTALEVIVSSDGDGTGEPATAFLSGTASTAFGPLPRLELEVVGSTAVITADESMRHLAPAPHAIEIRLGGRVLESIDVTSVERPVRIDATAARLRAVSARDLAHVRVRDWWSAYYGLDYPAEVPSADEPRRGDGAPLASDGPGVFVPTEAGAPTTVDLRDANGMIQVVGVETHARRTG